MPAAAPAPRPLQPAPAPSKRRAEVVPIRPRRRRWWPYGLLIIGGGAALFFFAQTHVTKQTPAAGPLVPTRVVANGVVERVIRVSGMTASPDSSLLLAPRLPGRGARGGSGFSLVLNDLAPAGARVKAGDVVASFDSLYMLNRLDDYRAQVVQHEGMIKKLRADLDVKRAQHNQLIRVAKANFDKALLDLKTAPVRSAIQIENFKLNRDEANAHLAELQKQSKLMEVSEQAAIRKYELDLADAHLELKRAQANADRMTLRAPRNGLVVLAPLRRGAEMGQVQVGDQIGSGQPVLQIVDTDSLVVDATVNQVDAEKISAGIPARIHLDAYPGLELPAKVLSVGYFARAEGRRPDWVRTMTVRLEVLATDPRVLPDLSASADLVLETSPEGPIIPLDFLTRENGKTAVYVRHGDTWQKQPVELGARNFIQAAALSGVKPGDVIGRPSDVAAILR